jgi:hypothetical protein
MRQGDLNREESTMKSLKTKLVLSALGIALLATPAFAQRPLHHAHNAQTQSQDPSTTSNDGSFTPTYVPGFGNENVPSNDSW